VSPLKAIVSTGFASILALQAVPAIAQSDTALEQIELRADNRPLDSLARAVEQGRNRPVTPGPPREIMNYRAEGVPSSAGGQNVPDAVLQTAEGSGPASVAGAGFEGTDNATNGAVLGFRIAPPDTDGHIGGTSGQYFVQMINLLTTIFDSSGAVLTAAFPSNDIWQGIGGNCEAYNQGDPIVLYDDQADRWLFSQFAFPDNMRSFSQCVAISQTDDPRDGYNRYEFSFNGIGFNDYPKHGIVTDSITLMANIFTKRGFNFSWGGSFLGVLDKASMYAGASATMRGFNIGRNEFGFVAGDLDGSGTAPALFATAMSSSDAFDIWQINPNWGGDSASINQIASVPITPYDGSLCGASRGACIPQPDGGPSLESLSDRLMHRLQIRDFGAYKTMLAAHTVDVGSGRAGIRWYELRDGGSGWALYQEGTYAPADGEYRWMPSIAMNGRGDIGMGFLLGGPSTYMSISATGQTAADSGSGFMDAAEVSCVIGGGVQTGVSRSGDYSSTSVDPSDDITFWHTNEYVNSGGNFVWDTYVCPFTIGDGTAGNTPPTAVINSAVCAGLSCDVDGSASSDSDGGSIVSYDWDFGDGHTDSVADPAAYTYGAKGNYTISLTVTDDGGLTGIATTDVTVDDGTNDSPTAVITSIDCTGLSCDFDGSGSSDPDGVVSSYSWTFGDGGTGSGATPNHVYTNPGQYSVKLTVTDGEGLDSVSPAEQDINVTEPSGPVSMSVSAIVVDTVNHGGGSKSPRAFVTIRDDQGNTVVGVTVRGDFTEDVGDSGVTGITGSDGVAELVSGNQKKGKVKFTFCVDDVTGGALGYESGDNLISCASN
jgi:PKD repeat protein